MKYEYAKLTIVADPANMQFNATFTTSVSEEDWGTGKEPTELLRLNRAGLEGWEAWDKKEVPEPGTGRALVHYLLKRPKAED